MADLLIRHLEPTIIKRLKLRAKQHHRSLQSELKHIIEGAIKFEIEEAKKTSNKWHKQLSTAKFSDSAALLREDRDH